MYVLRGCNESHDNKWYHSRLLFQWHSIRWIISYFMTWSHSLKQHRPDEIPFNLQRPDVRFVAYKYQSPWIWIESSLKRTRSTYDNPYAECINVYANTDTAHEKW